MADSRAHDIDPLNGAGRSSATGRFMALTRTERRVEALRRAVVEAVSPEDMAAVTRMLVFHATTGDLRAMRILYPYVLGKPAPAPKPRKLRSLRRTEHVDRPVSPTLSRRAENASPPVSSTPRVPAAPCGPVVPECDLDRSREAGTCQPPPGQAPNERCR